MSLFNIINTPDFVNNDKKYNKNNFDITVENGSNDTKSSESNDIRNFLGKISNKYSNQADQKHLNQLYNIGIAVANKKFNKEKLIPKLEKIIEERSYNPIPEIQESTRMSLIDAFKKGISDGSSDEYKKGFNDANQYQVTSKEKLYKRGYIDGVISSLANK